MNFQIKQAVPADGQAIGDLIQAVWAGMDHKEWYVPDDGPHITALLEEGKAIAFLALGETDGVLAGAFLPSFLAAARRIWEENTGFRRRSWTWRPTWTQQLCGTGSGASASSAGSWR